MKKIRLEQLGMAIKEKRGNRGLREIAKEMGVSHTTLSRIESGRQPDLDTFSKICQWLEINPADILNYNSSKPSVSNNNNNEMFTQSYSVQFRADRNFSPETAKKLGEMIMAVQKMINNEQVA